MQMYSMGDFDAFEELYRRHAQKVYGFLRRKLSTRTSVDDTYQEVWMKLHKFRGKYDATLPFVPWLFTLTRNTMIDTLRKQQRAKTEDTLEGVDFVASSPELGRDTDMPAYPELLSSLSAGEKQVVDMHYQWGLSFEEIAEKLGVKPTAARKMSNRAIQKLRSILK